MSDINNPIQSTASLLKALAAAIFIAVLLFVIVVLPAEFGIDPSGIGSVLGINNLGGVDEEPEIVIRSGAGELPFSQDVVDIELAAGSGLEYKFFLHQHSSLNYDWSSNAPLYFDMHGEPEGDTTGYFESYGATTADTMKGTVTVPFAGSHGWYWQNDSGEDVIITLTTMGNYEIIGLK